MILTIGVIITALLLWSLGIYAIYTYREIELAKLEHARKAEMTKGDW